MPTAPRFIVAVLAVNTGAPDNTLVCFVSTLMVLTMPNDVDFSLSPPLRFVPATGTNRGAPRTDRLRL
eukprot:6165060-Pyramimonas_sp.AAC.1